jgi:hypothetical protein
MFCTEGFTTGTVLFQSIRQSQVTALSNWVKCHRGHRSHCPGAEIPDLLATLVNFSVYRREIQKIGCRCLVRAFHVRNNPFLHLDCEQTQKAHEILNLVPLLSSKPLSVDFRIVLIIVLQEI